MAFPWPAKKEGREAAAKPEFPDAFEADAALLKAAMPDSFEAMRKAIGAYEFDVALQTLRAASAKAGIALAPS